jgi:rare lipoprotein A
MMGELLKSRALFRLGLMALAGAWLAGCATTERPVGHGTMRPYQVGGRWYRPANQPNYDETGLASWYGQQSGYRTTADGERFDPNAATAAHRTLPLPCVVEVTNLDNGRTVRLRVNDRGPFARGRILDVSRRGAQELGFLGKGMARVRVRYVGGASAGTTELARAEPAPPPASPAEPLVPAARIQAGSYADRADAERAAAQLAPRGVVYIEPAGAYWRVVVRPAAGIDADELRQEVIADGFAGARVIGPS